MRWLASAAKGIFGPVTMERWKEMRHSALFRALHWAGEWGYGCGGDLSGLEVPYGHPAPNKAVSTLLRRSIPRNGTAKCWKAHHRLPLPRKELPGFLYLVILRQFVSLVPQVTPDKMPDAL